MDDKGFHIRDIGQKGEKLQVINKLSGFLGAASDFKCENRAAAIGEIFFIQRLLDRVIADCRMVDGLHLRMGIQVVHDFQRIYHMALHAQGQRFQPLQEQEPVEGGQGGARIP